MWRRGPGVSLHPRSSLLMLDHLKWLYSYCPQPKRQDTEQCFFLSDRCEKAVYVKSWRVERHVLLPGVGSTVTTVVPK